MKRALTVIFLALAVSAARAGSFTPSTAYFTYTFSDSISGLNTNSIVGTNNIEAGLYHTFYITSTTNLNGSLFSLSVSSDAINWVSVGVLPIASTSGGTVTTNFVSKQSYYRISVTGTNVVGTISYLGGR
jgi:hypothetical protein